FSLFPDPEGEAWAALEPITAVDPYSTIRDSDGTVNRLWRCSDSDAIARIQSVLSDRELLIADGHHRYETARVYAHEVGGEGEHSYVLMFLCSLSDSGLTIFPTHRLLRDLDEEKRAVLRRTIEEDFTVEEIDAQDLQPP